MKKAILILTALASLTIASQAKAGTAVQDFNASVSRIDAELEKADAALSLSNGSNASLEQVKTVVIHARAEIEREKAIIKLGVAECVAAGTSTEFWDKAASIIMQLEQEIDSVNALL